MRRKIGPVAVFLLCVAISIPFALIDVSASFAAARVKKIEGTPKTIKSGERKLVPAKAGDTFAVGDTVLTEANSKAWVSGLVGQPNDVSLGIFPELFLYDFESIHPKRVDPYPVYGCLI